MRGVRSNEMRTREESEKKAGSLLKVLETFLPVMEGGYQVGNLVELGNAVQIDCDQALQPA